ncbi:energy-coupling factor ABC transporter substrate-binding protein [uncultured Caldilinea sp.]|jgi:cobalt/nickel transport protein|uniref:energy-coupling factor ABC transporter substrate-binding protein n=1 Tax=Caldilinea sp. TaxID=2293560 RepID=UPI0026249271|nr:energy-coupling factor ABC transporter substrate-binding protein [uncultured Caldilinea sp.]
MKDAKPSTSLSPWIVLTLIALFALLTVAPLLWLENSEFPGADALAEEAIQEIAPDVEPWFQPLWEPPGSETESLLFALQAAIGAGFIGYFFGWQRGRKEAAPTGRRGAPPA